MCYPKMTNHVFDIVMQSSSCLDAGLGSEVFSAVDGFDVILSSGVYVWTSCLAWRITVDAVEWLD